MLQDMSEVMSSVASSDTTSAIGEAKYQGLSMNYSPVSALVAPLNKTITLPQHTHNYMDIPRLQE